MKYKLKWSAFPIISRIVKKGQFTKDLFLIDMKELEDLKKDLKKKKISKEEIDKKTEEKRLEIQRDFGIDLAIKILALEESFHEDLTKLLAHLTSMTEEEIDNSDGSDIFKIIKDLIQDREFISTFFKRGESIIPK